MQEPFPVSDIANFLEGPELQDHTIGMYDPLDIFEDTKSSIQNYALMIYNDVELRCKS